MIPFITYSCVRFDMNANVWPKQKFRDWAERALHRRRQFIKLPVTRWRLPMQAGGTAMQLRIFGRTELQLSVLGFGCGAAASLLRRTAMRS